MNYTLHQLQVLVKVAELKSVTKASEALHLSQPAVSIQLKNLQENFDIPLIEVIGRQIYITEFGQEVVRSAQEILKQVNDINYKTHAYKGQLVGKLTISVVSTGKYVMPYFLGDFMNANEGIELKMDVTNRLKVLKALEDNDVDFALLSTVPKNLKIETETLMPNTLMWMSGNAFDNSADDNLEELKKYPLIYREYGSATRRAMEAFLKQNNFPSGKRLELTSNEAVKQATIAGLGVTLMPIIGLRNELHSEAVKLIPVKGCPITQQWNLIWLKNKKLSPVAEAYLKYIRKEKERIIKDTFSWYEGFIKSI
jgi:DNA-binding transcriptional LysR family regulator